MNRIKTVLLMINFGLIGHSFATKSVEELRAEIVQLKAQEARANELKDRLSIFNVFNDHEHKITEVQQGITAQGSLEEYVEHNKRIMVGLDDRINVALEAQKDEEKKTKFFKKLTSTKQAEAYENHKSSGEKQDVALKAYNAYIVTEEGRAALAADKRYAEFEQEIKRIKCEKYSYQLKNDCAEKYQKALICLQELNADASQGQALYMQYQIEEADLHTKWGALEQELNRLERASSTYSFVSSSARRPNSQPVDPSAIFGNDQGGSQGNKQKTDSKQKIASGSSSTKWIIGGSCAAVALIASGVALKKYLDARKKEEEKKKKQQLIASVAA